MKDPDRIETVFRVACDGIPIDTHDNYHDTMEEAEDYFVSLSHLPGCEYTIAEITTIETIHDLAAEPEDRHAS